MQSRSGDSSYLHVNGATHKYGRRSSLQIMLPVPLCFARFRLNTQELHPRTDQAHFIEMVMLRLGTILFVSSKSTPRSCESLHPIGDTLHHSAPPDVYYEQTLLNPPVFRSHSFAEEQIEVDADARLLSGCARGVMRLQVSIQLALAKVGRSESG